MTTPETAKQVISALALKLAIDTASVARAALAHDQSRNVSAGSLLMMRHIMITPDDDLAALLA